MSWIAEKLNIEPPQAAARIEEFLRTKLALSGKAGYILGLSGGLDSAVVAYLLARAVGPQKVALLNLPERDSKPLHAQHARQIAEMLGVSLQVQDITRPLEQMGVYNLLPFKYFPGQKLRELVVSLGTTLANRQNPAGLLEERLKPEPDSWIAKGNAYATAKHRLRMVLIYQHAGVKNLMVAGAANRTEYLTGTFSHWGCDHCADVMPILHLYRSQLSSLAAYLQIPGDIRTKPADPDLIPTINNKEEMLGSFEITDQILWGLEHDVPIQELEQTYTKEMVAQVKSLMELSRPMRETPYAIDSEELQL